MRKVAKWTIIIVSALAILIIAYLLINKINNGKIKKVSYKTVNKYFHTNVPDNSYIEKYEAEPDVYSDFCLAVKLNMRADEVEKVLSYYKEFEKKRNDDGYRWASFDEWGLNKSNYDYTIINFTSVKKTTIFGLSGEHTQRSMYIMVTKPQGGKVSVYMWVDKVGGGWKEGE